MSEYTSSGNTLDTESMVDISNEYTKEIGVIKKLLKLYTEMTGIKVPRHKIKIVNLEDTAGAMVIEDHNGGISSKDIVIVYDSSHLRERIQDDILAITVWHEVTHLVDIVNYNKIKSNRGKYKGYEFNVWTEYNARYTSMKLFMQYRNGTKEMFTGSLKHKQLESVTNVLKRRLLRLYKSYEDGDIDEVGKKFGTVYDLTQYFGEYSLFEELDYEYFKDAQQFVDLTEYGLGLNQLKELYDGLKSLKGLKSVFYNNEYKLKLREVILKLLVVI